ncbi:MAG: hypothetical protein L6W00_03915 [Lentisphaeria bacterium]|nr:MAG: hypothetical protein L6W00_03915 [Lentisphaeria bacterium]
MIAQELGLDDKEYQDAKHKYLRMHEITETDPFVILGIPSNIPTADKKKNYESFLLNGMHWRFTKISKFEKNQKKC